MDFKKEKKLLSKGYKLVAGLDEVGRGAWAGPIVAGVVVFTDDFLDARKDKSFNFFSKIKDSKLLNPDQREELFELITKNFIWSVGEVEAKEIDKIGISEANSLALRRAVENLKLKPDYLLIDYIKNININLPTQGIKGGDNKVLSIAAASIVAKVWRDRLMISYHKRFNRWYFNLHKGYGTKLHLERINKYGICSLHRKSFSPIKILQNY